jgi:hypothetical protein
MRHAVEALARWVRTSFGGYARAFKKPDNKVQFHASSVGRKCDVVIGLDFGTSCTKVVVRSPYEHNRAFAVPFGQAAHRSSPYLLPSVLWIGQDGKPSLTKVAGGIYLRDVKYYLMEQKPVPAMNRGAGGQTFDPKTVAVAFLALALRATRRWFLDTHKASFGSFMLDWQFNLGLPSADFAEEPLCHDYLRIAAAAWGLSVEAGPIELTGADAAYDAVKLLEDESAKGVGAFCDCGDRESAEIRLIPEVAAEVVGYARSYLRDEGLHILVDIGASTLDVCGFILHEKEGDDCYELLTADVRELGAMILHRGRLEAARGCVSKSQLPLLLDYDPVDPVPDELAEFCAMIPSVNRDLILESDDKYRKRCSQMLWQTLLALKTKRDPRSPRWKSKIPLFIAGGASGMAFYRESIKAISDDLVKLYQPCQGIQLLPLTKPDNLEADINDDSYHRFAVAWGLSYPDTNIGTVTRPCEISDIQRRRPTYDPPLEGIPKEWT